MSNFSLSWKKISKKMMFGAFLSIPNRRVKENKDKITRKINDQYWNRYRNV